MQLNTVERIQRVINFEPVDRLPMIEWAPWWDQTLKRWYSEGLPRQLTRQEEIAEYLGLDRFFRMKITALGPETPDPPSWGAPRIYDDADYQCILNTLYPQPAFDRRGMEELAVRHRRGEVAVACWLDGFFWHPRQLLGIEHHLYAFYDQPELIHRINQNLLAFNKRAIDELLAIEAPDFVAICEDMSYNHGPMLSRQLFDEFLAPYYRQLTEIFHNRGVPLFVDSDGNVTDMVPWLEEVGVDGILPLERKAGNDVVALRATHPHLRLLGAYDKMVMHKGEAAMRAEFERLLPVMRSGGFIIGVDHQTPPDVSLEQYGIYVQLMREFATIAAST